jgi:hypothetical protein
MLISRRVALAAPLAACLFIPAAAQIQNPIKGVRDAIQKAKEDAARQRQQQDAQRQQAHPQPQAAQGSAAGQTQQRGYPADFGTPEGTARIAASARIADVLGVKPGMEAKDVLPALKAGIPNYRISTFHVYEDTNYNPNDKSGPLRGVRAENPQQRDASGAFEFLHIDLTAPPGAGFVFGVSRFVPFPQGAQPTEATLVESLRKKYGPETANPDTAYTGPGYQGMRFGGGPGLARPYLWVFDAQGHLVRSQDAEDVMRNCQKGEVGGQRELILKTFYAQGRPEPPLFSQSCSTSTVFDARLTIAPNGLVSALSLAARNLVLRDSGELATWNWLDQRAKGQLEKQREDARKVAAPKL